MNNNEHKKDGGNQPDPANIEDVRVNQAKNEPKPKSISKKPMIIGGVITAVALVILVAILTQQPSHTKRSNATVNISGIKTAEQISWEYISDTWKPSGTPPVCPSPLLGVSPVDISKATAVLYPGQTRGNNYKAHGGFLFKNATNNNMPVLLSMHATVIDGSRYIQDGEVQYMFDFINSCGIRLRYDHLLTLSPTFQKIAETLPQPKVNDSQTTNIQNGQKFKAGQTIATAVGFPAPSLNVAMDFGVYDMRSPNEASKSSAYAAAHKSFAYADYYSICWLPNLPAADAKLALSLPGGDGVMGKTSDYCR